MLSHQHSETDQEKAGLVDIALKHGENGRSCSEAILVTYAQNFGLPRETAIRIASGFGGGMGLMGKTCGAVTAAFMVLGLRFGTDNASDIFSRQNTYMMVSEFAERFQSRFGSLNCRELCVGHSMATLEGVKKLRASGKPQKIIRDTVLLLEEIMTEHIEFKPDSYTKE